MEMPCAADQPAFLSDRESLVAGAIGAAAIAELIAGGAMKILEPAG